MVILPLRITFSKAKNLNLGHQSWVTNHSKHTISAEGAGKVTGSLHRVSAGERKPGRFDSRKAGQTVRWDRCAQNMPIFWHILEACGFLSS